jgi:hypothetical protein
VVARVAIGGHRGLPVASSYRPFWTGLGVLAAYLAMALSLTYYVRGRVGARRWRRAHRLIPWPGRSRRCTSWAPAPTPGACGRSCPSR